MSGVDTGCPPLFPGFFVGGFECSSHRLRDGRRLDLPAATRHVEFAAADYQRLADFGVRTARDGFSWHRVEARPGRRDFAAVVPLVRAARRAGVRVTWDLLHFGWPDDVDVFAPGFVDRFAALARDFAIMLANEGDSVPWISPVNEVSFLAWGGGDVACINPYMHGRGFELKCQLVRASIAAIEAVRDIERSTRLVVHDPAFSVRAAEEHPEDAGAAETTRQAQFQGCDLLSGRLWPQLGGRPDYLDVIGVNYYPWNQWTYGTPLYSGELIARNDPRYRPLSEILVEWQRRYDRPTYLGETGCEGEGRTAWLRYACDEIAVARGQGADVDGLCLYPIVDFPGWDDDRHCETGLWGYADDRGEREIHRPLADEMRFQQRRLAAIGVTQPQRWPTDPAAIPPHAIETVTPVAMGRA